MPLFDHGPEGAPPELLDADFLKVAMLKRGELLALARPPGETWYRAHRRFEALGARLVFTLQLWHVATGERWYVVRMR